MGGGGGATGKVYQLKDTQLSDDGTAIPSYYTTHYFPERAVEQSLSLGAHRKLFSYLTMFVEGAGNLSLTSFTDSVSAPQTQQPLPLSSLSDKDLVLPINVLGERVAFQVSTNQPGAWSPEIHAIRARRSLGPRPRPELVRSFSEEQLTSAFQVGNRGAPPLKSTASTVAVRRSATLGLAVRPARFARPRRRRRH
jgi:hypothetical protein